MSICVILTGCASFNDVRGYGATPFKEPAKLISYSFDERFVHIEVLSYGCTLISSFELKLVDKENNSLQVFRKKPDNCKVKPIKVSLNYAFRHLGVDNSRPINIVNPIFSQDLVSIK